ncbi:histone deacetylase [Halococcus dombrowskii]|uniref:Histone deacetylase n=1 Tax=Halococcus dombrowskii TaxID=179637 RepID=A0AAV3SLB3_HALDO|nr:histone deacetylase [Halococcus dombrowskii]UOO95860.1 histone deacetylase [Halococcus dombrowskii]
MRYGYSSDCLNHDTGPRHPESPDRLRAIRQGLSSRHGVEYVEADAIGEAQARAVHDDEYVKEVREFCADGGGQWDPDTVAVEATWEAALKSAGQAVWSAHEALDGTEGRETPFAIGRPPGHHAVADDAMGFCFLNNAAIAAQSALDGAADRVAIIDWDVHHGNGIQDIFYDRDDVFYCSIHERGLYPGSGEVGETGEGDGEGTTANVAFPAGGDDDAYLATVDDVFAPLLTEFDPDLLLVSAGFDAHEHDPISRMTVSTEGYGVLAARVRDLAERCDAGLGFVLEGGYGLETLSESINKVNEVFEGYEPVAPDGEVDDRLRSILDDARTAHGLGEK